MNIEWEQIDAQILLFQLRYNVAKIRAVLIKRKFSLYP